MKNAAFCLLISIWVFSLGGCGGAKKRTHPRVVIVGLDGAGWEHIDPLIAQGRLPLFKKLKEQSAWGTLRTTTPAKSPIIWTSIATGKTTAKHGIDDFRSKKRSMATGKYQIFNSTDIRQPLIWEMLGAGNRRSVLVNWYLSFPPQPLNGVNVSDYYRMRAFQHRDDKQGKVDNTVYPPSLAADFERFVDGDYEKALRETGLPDFPRLFNEQGGGRQYTDHGILKKYAEFVIQENLVQKLASHLFRTEEFDFFASYFKMADVVQHFAYDCFVDEASKEKWSSTFTDAPSWELENPGAYARVADILYPVYRNFEVILEDYLSSEKNKDAYFIILSDHSFHFFQRDRSLLYNHVNGMEKAPNGIIMIKGPGVLPGKIALASIFDIAPTVLYLQGLPLDRDMDGKPLFKVFSFRNPIRYTRYQKKKPQFQQRSRELDEKALQELKALGYIN